MNELICWAENGEKKWEMVKEKDYKAFLLNLMQNKEVDTSTIFIVPTGGMVNGIWLFPDTHKSNRVDFWNFHEDFGTVYKRPKASQNNQKILDEMNEKNRDDTKYGFISPDGKYFHCCYQGHINLADRICFGIADTDNAERYLEEHGWLKVYKSLGDRQYSVYTGENHTITDAQMKTLIDMELDTADGVSQMLTDERDF